MSNSYFLLPHFLLMGNYIGYPYYSHSSSAFRYLLCQVEDVNVLGRERFYVKCTTRSSFQACFTEGHKYRGHEDEYLQTRASNLRHLLHTQPRRSTYHHAQQACSLLAVAIFASGAHAAPRTSSVSVIADGRKPEAGLSQKSLGLLCRCNHHFWTLPASHRT
ncbi:hypothetical protein BDQ17DRAFT_946833 [Cyathus striatus]|nr:hypothetical protein BDQ17DRAFT_946833 [Cyathus striatus]